MEKIRYEQFHANEKKQLFSSQPLSSCCNKIVTFLTDYKPYIYKAVFDDLVRFEDSFITLSSGSKDTLKMFNVHLLIYILGSPYSNSCSSALQHCCNSVHEKCMLNHFDSAYTEQVFNHQRNGCVSLIHSLHV